jgi:hypothetical protein
MVVKTSCAIALYPSLYPHTQPANALLGVLVLYLAVGIALPEWECRAARRQFITGIRSHKINACWLTMNLRRRCYNWKIKHNKLHQCFKHLWQGRGHNSG